jgi:hypothetical protein
MAEAQEGGNQNSILYIQQALLRSASIRSTGSLSHCPTRLAMVKKAV